LFSILFRHPAPQREDYLIADLAELGTTGINEEQNGIRAFFDDSADGQALLTRFSEFAPTFRQEDRTDWEQISRDAWPSFPVGRGFYLVPPWRKNEPTPYGRVRLDIYPGMACGTGRHPATQLCLQAIEQHVLPGDSVLDVGSGSGILAQAATLIGAGRVIACDSDPQAIGIARENYPSVPFFVGSADAAQSRWADVIIANIDSATIEQLAPELERVRKPDSTLILSGFPAWDTPEGFHPTETLEQDGWLCFVVAG